MANFLLEGVVIKDTQFFAVTEMYYRKRKTQARTFKKLNFLPKYSTIPCSDQREIFQNVLRLSIFNRKY